MVLERGHGSLHGGSPTNVFEHQRSRHCDYVTSYHRGENWVKGGGVVYQGYSAGQCGQCLCPENLRVALMEKNH
ncbi:hypothetical protein CCP4SC76_7730005 [Gammaproteobacteria bacterium]